MLTNPCAALPRQLPLDANLEEALVLQEARVLYDASRFLSGRYASFAKLMADPLVGRCMRLSAAQRVRLKAAQAAKRTRGR